MIFMKLIAVTIAYFVTGYVAIFATSFLGGIFGRKLLDECLDRTGADPKTIIRTVLTEIYPSNQCILSILAAWPIALPIEFIRVRKILKSIAEEKQ